MKKLMLLVVTIHIFTKSVHSVNGVIWNKKLENFVPIFSVPTFATVDYEIKNQSRKEEITTFQGRRFRFACYEVKTMFLFFFLFFLIIILCINFFFYFSFLYDFIKSLFLYIFTLKIFLLSFLYTNFHCKLLFIFFFFNKFLI